MTPDLLTRLEGVVITLTEYDFDDDAVKVVREAMALIRRLREVEGAARALVDRLQPMSNTEVFIPGEYDDIVEAIAALDKKGE